MATTSRHGASAARARSSRRRVTAAPTGESGRAAPPRRRPARYGASRSRVATGRPRSPARWTCETSRQIAAQPARPRRGRRRARATGHPAEPAAVGGQVAERAAPDRRPGSRAGSTAVDRVGLPSARSTPSTGRIPAAWQARANFTAP